MAGDYYSCPTCRDTGWVNAYHPVSMREAIEAVDGKRDKHTVRLYECVIACVCDSGDKAAIVSSRLAQRSENGRGATTRDVIRANDERVWRIDIFDRSDAQREALLRMAREYVQKRDERRAEREAPYQVFDSWNEGGE